MKKFLDAFKGFLIGIANIIPGVSGGTLAVLTGLYDVIIYNLSHFFEHPWRAIKDLFFVFCGAIIGVASGYFLIGWLLLPNFPLEMCFLFAGLIIGGLPLIMRECKGSRLDIKKSCIFLVSFAILIVLAFLKVLNVSGTSKEVLLTPINALIMVLLGFIAAFSMIVPGISGSVILLSLGYYNTIINIIKYAFQEFFTFNFSGGNFFLLVLFAIGVLIGIIVSSKVIEFLIRRFFYQTYVGIIGLVLGSSIGVMIIGINDYINLKGDSRYLVLHIIVTIIAFVGGSILGKMMSKLTGELNYENEASKRYKDALNDLCDVLRYRTVLDEYKENGDAPFGMENKKCLEHVLKMGERDGFAVKNVDNYAGHIAYGDGKEIIGILGHLDVVPAVGNWTNDPFTPTVRKGKLYARGALDDKGGVIASYYALKIIKELNLPISKQIRLIVGCDEETGSRCLERYFTKEEKPSFAISPDASFPMIYGEKGILTFDITGTCDNENIVSFDAGMRYNIVPDLAVLVVKDPKQDNLTSFLAKNSDIKAEFKDQKYYFYGKASHAMEPQNGINAANNMFKFMDEYYPSNVSRFILKTFDTNGKKLDLYLDDPEMHELTINLGIAHYDHLGLKLGYNLRVPTDEHVEKIHTNFTNNLEQGLMLSEFHYSPRHFVSLEEPELKILLKAYQEISKDFDSKPMTIGGGTYARILERAVAYGPNFPQKEDLCHQPDENISIDDFIKWIAIYAKAIYELAK